MTLIEHYISNNYFGRLLGMNFTILEDGVVHYFLTISEDHLATPTSAHGGCMASLLDATMGVGALSLVSQNNQVVATIEMKINFLKSAKLNDELMATSRVIKNGSKIIVMFAEIRNQKNELLALSSGTFLPYDAAKAGY
ncbi:MAG: PaaI family thioesterase [Flavobacteriia bacterium]|nr:PaaI family thioesterase [Flavobacteriia bacterium]